MKRIFACFILGIVFLTAYCNTYTHPSVVYAQPPYAKWGKLAVEKTKEKYPKAQIIDYLHIGRKPKTVNITTEKFKLWLREDGKEYGVFVDVEFDTKTEKFLKITFQKSNR
ncbi:YqzG/YhdC family protein [Bacillus sp. Xin]|uniref:YqzG/YhdC family protein n=1 Tax=unclassified Bacillus (in: firmicutes) TaxID=185979 RepID=UPI00157302F5|nr:MULTISPECIES: YqzG/YhdC family protein [unclassified Bacillus (in: firmicutes)]MBC6973320.1 YqzG/YhdC family protein [Bacillus sp. Xin]NSW35677.1 YqzG/YhdC family protein [Bacillus sp. Xin1]